MRAVYTLVLGSILGLSSAGCASSEPNYYALTPTRGAVQTVVPHLVEIRRPGLAGYLDRASIVKRVADHRVRVSSDDSWGEPLGDMIGRVLAENLSTRVPSSIFFSEGGALEMAPDALVEVNVQRLDVGDDGDVVLVAQAAVEPISGAGPKASRNVTLHAHASGTTTSIVEASSVLIGQLSDVVVVLLQTPPQPPTPNAEPAASPALAVPVAKP